MQQPSDGAPPYFPVILDGDLGVFLGDIGRVTCLVIGVILVCLLVRGYVVDRRHPTPYGGFRMRLAALGTFALVACLSEYGRLGEPMSLRLPLNVLALGLALLSLARLQGPRPAVDHEDWLRRGGQP